MDKFTKHLLVMRHIIIIQMIKIKLGGDEQCQAPLKPGQSLQVLAKKLNNTIDPDKQYLFCAKPYTKYNYYSTILTKLPLNPKVNVIYGELINRKDYPQKIRKFIIRDAEVPTNQQFLQLDVEATMRELDMMYKASTGKDYKVPIKYYYDHDQTKKEIDPDTQIADMVKMEQIVLIAKAKFIMLEIFQAGKKSAEFQVPEAVIRDNTAKELYQKMHAAFNTTPFSNDSEYFYEWRKKKVSSKDKITPDLDEIIKLHITAIAKPVVITVLNQQGQQLGTQTYQQAKINYSYLEELCRLVIGSKTMSEYKYMTSTVDTNKRFNRKSVVNFGKFRDRRLQITVTNEQPIEEETNTSGYEVLPNGNDNQIHQQNASNYVQTYDKKQNHSGYSSGKKSQYEVIGKIESANSSDYKIQKVSCPPPFNGMEQQVDKNNQMQIQPAGAQRSSKNLNPPEELLDDVVLELENMFTSTGFITSEQKRQKVLQQLKRLL